MYLCIFNPIARRGKAVRIFEKVKEYFDNKNVEYTVWTTTCRGDATMLAKKAVNSGYKNIISVGGDGTLLEVVSGLIGTDCTLGIIPAGTGNDFVRSLGIGSDYMKAAEIILNGKTAMVDIGSDDKGHFFVNVAGAGFDTEVVKYTEKSKKIVSGLAAYVLGLLQALLHYRNTTMRITMDGQTIEKKVFLIAVANGSAYGGGMKVAPNATPFDGYFDITFFESIARINVLILLPFFIKGKHNLIKNIKNYKCKHVTIEIPDGKNPVNMDGEIIGTTPVTLSIIGKAIRMFVPNPDISREGI